MKILVDENLSPDWVFILSPYASEVVHWSSVGQSNAADLAITAYAREKNFIILTQDLDFGTILAFAGNKTPSVIVLRAGRVSPTKYGMRVIEVLHRLQTELTAGAFVTIEEKRTRLSPLPFPRKH